MNHRRYKCGLYINKQWITDAKYMDCIYLNTYVDNLDLR